MEAKPLFRNLLRQASILYDDVARSYMTRYIKQRFQVNRGAGSFRLSKLLKEGRRGLSVLIRANTGDPKPLLKVLEMSYGRVGRRRHELLKVYNSDSFISTYILAEGFLQIYTLFPISKTLTSFYIPKPILDQPLDVEPVPLIPEDPRTRPPAIPAALRALIISQRGKNITASVEPELPDKNIWGRPLSLRREANMRRRHHSDLLRRVLPPLDNVELERLERLTCGLEAPKPPKRQLKTELPVPKCAKPHNITSRFKKRMWKKILIQSPSLDFDVQRSKWKATYSRHITGPVTSVGDSADFEGLADERRVAVPRDNRHKRAKDIPPAQKR